MSPRIAEEVNKFPSLLMLFPLGESALSAVTGQQSLDKWNLSPLNTLSQFICKRCVPSFSPSRLRAQPELTVYWTKTFARGCAGAASGPWPRKPQNFIIDPKLTDALDILNECLRKDVLSLDIETGRNQINTFGVAWSPNDAMALNCLTDRLGDENFYKLWKQIARVVESPVPKVYQNFIYEAMYFSWYGIRAEGLFHDTMLAQKVLWPEFEMGLANVGRFYTNEPYWKDDGKITSTGGGRKDWGNVRDWQAHYEYNCKDTSNTFEAYLNQKKDLEARGLSAFFYDYVMRLGEPITEMCARGLPVDVSVKERMHAELTAEIERLRSSLSQPINPNSTKQKLELFRAKKYKLPRVRSKQAGGMRDAADELAIKKLRLKHPEDTDLDVLLKYAKAQKSLSSYVNAKIHKDGRLRFSLLATGTETLRFSSGKDAWGYGLNAQTLPKKFKSMFTAPEGKQWLQVDLKQAESRFVAYDSCDVELMRMLEAGEDIHSRVAAEIFGCPVEQVLAESAAGDKSKRQLGKKSGHGANYSMKENTFIDSCLKEMDLVLPYEMAHKTLEAYHTLFPNIRMWHADLRKTLFRERKLRNPFGWERYFYGRLDDNTFREAYAFRPQSTIPMITNHLMLKLCDIRREGKVNFELCLQVHDSILMLCNSMELPKVAEFARDLKNWHPEVILPAGKLLIPVDVEVGTNLGKLKEWSEA